MVPEAGTYTDHGFRTVALGLALDGLKVLCDPTSYWRLGTHVGQKICVCNIKELASRHAAKGAADANSQRKRWEVNQHQAGLGGENLTLTSKQKEREKVDN